MMNSEITQAKIYLNQPSPQLQESILQSLHQYLNPSHHPNYIWHHAQPPSIQSTHSDPSLIQIKLRYGQSIQDEWFLVSCLFQISLSYDVLIQITDDDGEFLLIEAAQHLPKWITPHLANGRVWIKSGSLHLIPLDHPLALNLQSSNLPLSIALQILRSSPSLTLESPLINQSLKKRIEASEPSQLLKSHLYNTEAYLHRDIARVLRKNPNLIGLAVNAFVDKDQRDFKACQHMSRFPPSSLPDANHTSACSSTIQLTPIRMTRPLYAVLLNHQLIFHPPKPFEKAQWISSDLENTSEWKRRMLGMKLCCGFEMVFQSELASSSLSQISSDQPRPKVYQTYLNKLTKTGFFKDEIEGSQLWNELESQARQNFLEAQDPVKAVLSEALDSLSLESQDTEKTTEDEIIPENDDWIQIDDAQLQKLFTGVPEKEVPLTAEDEKMAEADASKFATLVDRVERFVEADGTLEGALNSDDERSSDEDSETDSEGDELRADLGAPVSKKAPRWARRKKATEYDEQTKKRLEALVPGVNEADWGRKDNKPFTNVPTSQNNAQSPSKSGPDSQTSKPGHSVPVASASQSTQRGFAKEIYDGVCEDETSEDDDEDDLEKEFTPADGKKPMTQDLEMEGEREEFLAFARKSLGLSEDQYEQILSERRSRGAYVPPVGVVNKKASSESDDDNDDDELKAASGSGKAEKSKPTYSSDRYMAMIEGLKDLDDVEVEASSDPKQSTKRNPKLDTFENFMAQMDQELRKEVEEKELRKQARGGPLSTSMGPFPEHQQQETEVDDDEDDDDSDFGGIDAEMRDELNQLMAGSDEAGQEELIDNLLQTLRANGGGMGPFNSLVGRLGDDEDWRHY